MGIPAVVAGELKTILRLGPAGMRNPSEWTQMDSDVIAHFLQVHGQIARSRWASTQFGFRRLGERVVESCSPQFEDFVFAAVYFRQLIAKKDHLFKDAVDRYCRFVARSSHAAWIKEELRRFNANLDGEATLLAGQSVRDVFDAFIYGAGLMHKMPRVASQHRTRFLSLYDYEKREELLYSLHMSLRMLLNNVGHAAAVIHRDLALWIHEHALPLPDVRWHDSLFEMKGSG